MPQAITVEGNQADFGGGEKRGNKNEKEKNTEQRVYGYVIQVLFVSQFFGTPDSNIGRLSALSRDIAEPPTRRVLAVQHHFYHKFGAKIGQHQQRKTTPRPMQSGTAAPAETPASE